MSDLDHSSVDKAAPKDSLSPSPDVRHVERKLHKSPEERQAALTHALAVDPGVKAGSWRALQVRTIRPPENLLTHPMFSVV